MAKVTIKADGVRRANNGKITLLFTCPKCSVQKDIDSFGVRNMNGGVEVRRQSYCRKCRSAKAIYYEE